MLIYLRKNLNTKKYILTNIPIKSYPEEVATYDFRWIDRSKGKFECRHKGGNTRYPLYGYHRGKEWYVGVRIGNQDVLLTII